MSDTSGTPQANWYPDPLGRHERRYWDGQQWTEHVFTKGVQSVDPMTTSPAPDAIATPMATGTVEAVSAASPTAAQPVAQAKVGFFGARKIAERAIEENTRLQALIDQYGLREVTTRDAVRQDLERRIVASLRPRWSGRTSYRWRWNPCPSARAVVVPLVRDCP